MSTLFTTSHGTSTPSTSNPSQATVPSRIMSWLVRNAGLDLPQTNWRRYGIACSAIAVALLCRWGLDPIMAGRGAYGFFLVATAFVAWRCGTAPALFTVAGGAVFGTFFEDPTGSLQLSHTAYVSLIVSVLIGSATAVFCGSLRHTASENARLYRLACENDQRKDEFLAMLAHELRNPLAPLTNATYLLRMLRPHAEQVELMHRMIESQVEHLTHLVDDLLDVSRIRHDRITLRFETFDFQRAVDDAVAAVQGSLNERKHDLQVKVPSSPVYLRADRVRITQVLINLLINAIKYTPPSGRIWLTAERDGPQLEIRVRDTGIGLAPHELIRVFNLFEQAGHSPDQAKGGLGIGLTLVRRLVEMHGGTAEGQSAGRGLGSEFTVRIPWTNPPNENPPVSEPLAELPALDDSPQLRILVVEDTDATAKSMTTMLKLWRHETRTCADGFAALEVIRDFKPDVVLTDIGLPQMSGYQLATEVQRLPNMSEVVLIAMTGYGQPADHERSRLAGFTRHLTKPINPTELEQLLATLKSGNAPASAS
ncbi:MAG: response regulator [Planctomycetaceae bacterium]|nr:response regulator [Planctomycetaceae bacterium]